MSELDCGTEHLSIEDAIAHARRNLGGLDNEPYWGTMGSTNVGWVVGYKISSRKRWRLDFDPQKLVHVNEENFDGPFLTQKIIHRVRPAAFDSSGTPLGNDTQVRLYWRKWTTRYGMPGLGAFCEKCRTYHSGGECPYAT
jgi:hypothetical protein